VKVVNVKLTVVVAMLWQHASVAGGTVQGAGG
jgi:hypothetical protein